MIIVKNNFIPFGSYSTINILSILFTKRESLSDKTMNHEKIHSQQMLEMGLVGIVIMFLVCLFTNISMWWILSGIITFYIWYCSEYIFVRFFHKKQNNAYHDISLEEEAYIFDDDLEYLNTRKPFKWVEYLSPKSY